MGTKNNVNTRTPACSSLANNNNGSIGKGVFEQVYGGEDFDSGKLVFGMKGGC